MWRIGRSPLIQRRSSPRYQRRLLLALLAELAVALADLAVATVSLSGLLLIGPLTAAHRLTTRRTAVVAGAAVALALLLPATADGEHLVRVLIVAIAGLWAIRIAHTDGRHRAALGRVTRLAEIAQEAVSPPLPSQLGGLRLAAHTRSASPHARLGGDLHDAVAIPTGVRLIVGDVKGHGLDAVRHSAAVLSAFRRTAASAPDIAGLARRLDAHVAANLDPEDFITILLVEFTPGQVTLVNCGHPPPLRIGRRLTFLHPPEPSPPLGLSPDPRPHRSWLLPSDRLLLYTDGLSAVLDPHDALFRLDDHLCGALAAPTLDQALDNLLDLLDRCGAGAADPTDDLTAILIQPSPAVPPPCSSQIERSARQG